MHDHCSVSINAADQSLKTVTNTGKLLPLWPMAGKNTDKRKDTIGELGDSLEKMASQIHVLLGNNESLVKDQRDLMQALTHEFRAPMARMRFALEMHDDGLLEANSHNELSLALDDLTELVSEMLYYARLQTSAPDLNPTPYHLTG